MTLAIRNRCPRCQGLVTRQYVGEPLGCVACGWEDYNDLKASTLTVGQYPSSLAGADVLPTTSRIQARRDRAKRATTRSQERRRALAKREAGETLSLIALSLGRSTSYTRMLISQTLSRRV